MEKQQRKSSPKQDLTGIKFNMLTPLYYIKGGKWHCLCDYGVLSHLIEYQGEQHFKQVEGKWGENFELNQYYDQLKREYCKIHNIKLIEIKFNQEYSLKDLI